MSAVAEVGELDYRYDLDQRKVVLLGDVALDQVIVAQPYVSVLARKEKVVVPGILRSKVNLPHLDELLTVRGALPEGLKVPRGLYSDLPLEDYFKYGQWLQMVAQLGDWAVRERIIDSAAKLELGPGTDMIISPKRFKTITAFQLQFGHKGVLEDEPPISEINDWELARKLRIILDEGIIPSKETLNARYQQGLQGPRHDVFNRHGISFPLTLERIGILTPKIWDKRKFAEWSYIFMQTNNRMFVARDIDSLSKRRLGPTPSNRGVMVKTFGSLSSYQKYSQKYFSRRSEVVFSVALHDASQRKLPPDLLSGIDSHSEGLRRLGRFRMIGSLFPEINELGTLHLCEPDLQGAEFTEYLNNLGRDIPQWMAEAAAWDSNCVPDLFPEGELYQKLKIAPSESSAE